MSVLLEGTLTADPRFPTGSAPTAAASIFLIASNRSFRQDGWIKRETSFFPIATKPDTLKNGTYPPKQGQRVRIAGRLRQSPLSDEPGLSPFPVVIAESVEVYENNFKYRENSRKGAISMNDLNSVLVEGNLTADPQFRTVGAKNTPLATFSIAHNYTFLKNGITVSDTAFFDIETWAEIAQTVRMLAHKGQAVKIVGRLKQSRWTDPAGKNRYRVSIIGNAVEFRPLTNTAPQDNTVPTPQEGQDQGLDLAAAALAEED
jgi:single-strand DNA-binding protein